MPTATNMMMLQIAQENRDELAPMGHVQKAVSMTALESESYIVNSKGLGTRSIPSGRQLPLHTSVTEHLE